MTMRLAGSGLAVLLCAPALAGEQGLVAHYRFDGGVGSVARDDSGRNNHGSIKGGAKFVKRGDGFALQLDGVDDFVECRPDPSLAIESAGTVEIWFRAEELQGGLVNWSTGSSWHDERLVLAFITYTGSSFMLATTADGEQRGAMPDNPETARGHTIRLSQHGHGVSLSLAASLSASRCLSASRSLSLAVSRSLSVSGSLSLSLAISLCLSRSLSLSVSPVLCPWSHPCRTYVAPRTLRHPCIQHDLGMT